jgi:hypothetical protein
MNDILEDYVTEDELASQLKLNERTLQRWRQQRVGPPPTFMGKRIMYHVPSFKAWLKSRELKMVRSK